MSGPPLPPRPDPNAYHNIGAPPPIPPPPANRHGDAPPLAAPRPQKFNPDVEGDISRNLDEFAQYQQPPSHSHSSSYSGSNFSPGHTPSISLSSSPNTGAMAYRPPPPPQLPYNLNPTQPNPAPGWIDPRRSPAPTLGPGGPGQGPPPMWNPYGAPTPAPPTPAPPPPPQGYNTYGQPPPPQWQSSPPPPQQQPWQGSPQPPQQPWRTTPSPRPQHQQAGSQSLNASMAALSFSPPQQPTPQPAPTPAQAYAAQTRSPPPGSSGAGSSSNANTSNPPSLTAPLPTIATLSAAVSAVQAPGADHPSRVAWCRDVLQLVDRTLVSATSSGAGGSASEPPLGPANLADDNLVHLVSIAAPMVLSLAATAASYASTPYSASHTNGTPVHIAEAVFLKATLEATGYFPQFVDRDPRKAFRDYELAARSGFSGAWFKLGRDYENFGDAQHARDCFERGVRLGVESCIYRMGMAHLLGQLGVPASQDLAIPLLHRAATLATITCPQPAYVYALLLLSEFSFVAPAPTLFLPFLSPPLPSSPSPPPPHILEAALHNNARAHLERAAYLAFAPAQYKLGHAYEFANPPFPYDPLLSVQYYSLASQQGEIEADMALSKWFLCGAEGAFDKDESLAWTFAEKAARKGLPSAEFAMGYYAEVGVGGAVDVETAKRWYSKAAAHGNEDAPARLTALNQAAPQALSRQEHDALTENKLLRKRTQAQQRSNARPEPPPEAVPPLQPQQSIQRPNVERVVGVARRTSKMVHPGVVGRRPGTATPQGSLPPSQAPTPQPQQQRPSTVADYGQDSGRGRGSVPNPNPNAGPGGGPQGEFGEAPGGRRPYQHKYTLSDTGFQGPPPGSGGSISSGGPGTGSLYQTQTRPRPGMGGREGSTPSVPSVAVSAPPGGPGAGIGAQTLSSQGAAAGADAKATPGLTFEQMGFHGAKAENKDCVVM